MVADSLAYNPRIAGGSLVWRHNRPRGASPQEIVIREIVPILPAPEPAIALLQLAALATVIGVRSRTRRR
jgi:hypothetical protein